MTDFLKIILIGIIEGITEWLPVSSTGHMLLFDAFLPLDMSESFKEMFFVVIQLGAVMAVVTVFWRKMLPVSVYNKKVTVERQSVEMWLKVAVACVPSGIAGLLFDSWLEEKFGTPLTIAAMLIIYGVLFILVENRNSKRPPKIFSLQGIDFKTAVLIGLFQVLSLVPGTSRSGASFIGALLLGVSRTAAAEFTFFLAVPTMLGASVFKILKFGFDFSQNELVSLIIGMAVAYAVSMLSINFLMNYVRRKDFKAFGIYRIILGTVILLLTAKKMNP